MRNFLRLGKRSWQVLLLTLLGVCTCLSGMAQAANTYTFAASTGATLEDMTGSTTLVAASSDDGASSVTNIGFAFTYAGTAYTQFSANVNGLMRLGATAVTTSYDNASTSTGFLTTTNIPKIAPLYDDLHTGTTAGGGKVHYKLVGTTVGSRKLVVEWYVTVPRLATGTANGRFQVWLNETSNTFDFVYGAIGANTTNSGSTIGHASSATAYQSVTASAGTVSTTAHNSTNTAAIAAGTRYTFTPPAGCTGTPTAGTAAATVTSGCSPVATTLSLTGASTSSGLTYQWQSSATSGGTYTAISGATSATYAATATATTYYRAVVTCSNSSLSSTSTPVGVTVISSTPSAYAALPITESFESWTARCGTTDLPSTAWANTPSTGNASWRRDDQGASASWTSPTYGVYSPVFTQGAHSARFHSSYASPSGTTGALDLYADLSAAGTKTLTFDYINTSGSDKLQVFLSNDGGATFGTTALLTLTTATAFTAQSVTFTGTSATSVVRLLATSDYAATDIGVDNLSLAVTPACQAVTFSATTAITSSSATVNFAAGSGGSSYSLTYSPGGSTPQTVSPGANPLSGLTPSTAYTVTVTTNCAGGVTNTASTTFTTPAAPPANDDCAGAISLSATSGTCTATSGTTVGATTSTPASACTGTADDDVWYSFVAATATQVVTVTGSSTFDAVVELRSGTCTSSTNISCADATYSGGTETLTATGLTTGATYFVRVYNYYANSSTSNPPGTFTICVTKPVPPANDECSAAIGLTPGAAGAACSSTSGTTVNATASGQTATCGGTADDDVWYSFVATGTRHTITVTGSSTFDAVVDLRSGNCTSSTNISCADATDEGGTETLVATGLTGGLTYYVRVYNYYANSSTSYPPGTFTICVTTPANLPCAQVTNAAVTNTGSTATASTAQLTFTAATGAATSNAYSLTLTPTAGGSTINGTFNSSPVNLSGLTPNTSYTVTITTNCANGGASDPVTIVFTSQAAPVVPANDDCAGAISLSATSATCTNTNGTTAGATASSPTSGCDGTADDDVWYSFVAAAANQVITVTGGSTFDAVVELRSGTCASSTNLKCADATLDGGTETLAATGLTVGATYFVRVYEYYTNNDGINFPGAFTICITKPGDLIVDGTNSSTSTPYSASGSYNNVTVNNSGTLSLSANLTVLGTTTINSGGTFNTASSQVVGPGNFVLNAGGTLGIGGTAGISVGPATTGVIRNTGSVRSFSTDANYVYSYVGSQSTGLGLTGARNLSKTSTGTLTVSGPTSVSQVVSATSGPIAANSNLTLLSSASGTALAVNGSTTNLVSGTLTAQRYIGGIGGAGYRMVATPVTTTLNALTSGGSSIDVSGGAAYNSSLTPGAVTPYPTLFTYDQTRAGTTGSDQSAFNQGFKAATALSTAFAPGAGVDFNTTSGQTLKFTGTVNNADYTATLANNGNAAGGWALLGNPFPAPFSWDGVTLGSAVSPTVYVSQATSRYAGTYTSYTLNAPMQVPPRASSLIPLGQAFFVRSTANANNGITIPGTARATTFDATLHPVQRQAADTRTALRLALAGAGQDDDYAVVYFDAQATAGLDVQLDAVKFFNTGAALNLCTSASGQALTLNALPLPGAASVSVPVEVRVPQAGTYALSLHELANLPAGTTLELRDALTGTRTVLAEGTSYGFSASTNAVTGRFTLLLNPASALAVAAGLSAEAVTVYPNPAHHRFTVSVPGVSGATSVQAELVNTLGQVVRRTSVALPATGTSFVLDAPEVATGVYVLRLQTGSTSIAKRVTLE